MKDFLLPKHPSTWKLVENVLYVIVIYIYGIGFVIQQVGSFS